MGGLVVAVVCVLAAAAVVFASAKASLSSDPSALAKIAMPLGGGSVQSVSVVTGPHSARVAVKLTGDPVILPAKTVAAGHRYEIRVVVRRPGWISWLAGKTETLTRTVTAPAASLRSRYVTLERSGALRLRFTQPIRVISYGAEGHLVRHVLASPQTEFTLPHSTDAGTTHVSAQVQPWETSSAAAVSWFPAGTKASAVASPVPGSQIKPGTPITLTFSKPVSRALGSHRPLVSPATPGRWHQISSHAIVFRPQGSGYGLGQKVSIALPSDVRLSGATQNRSSSTGHWTVPAGSTVRLQQMLAVLGYLPLSFHYRGSSPGTTAADQENAAVTPPKGTFSWRFSDTPATLKSFWKVGASGTMMQGAVMMFEAQHGLTVDGIAGPVVWKALIGAMIHHQHNRSGYSFVQVSVTAQSLNLWHDGKTIIASTAVNTGAAGTPTQAGTWPVFEHVAVTTMSGTNPDGSHYSDPGIHWVSYFHGGDALHEFTRAQYGLPQSLGCVEMPPGPASEVYPYTPIGTLVHVT
ncbi:MAG: L,D-transpeptidase family protein [Trebonia sp.]